MSEGAPKLKTYKKTLDYSYASGAFAVYGLIGASPELVRAVYIHSDFTDGERLEALCRDKSILVERDDRAFSRIGQKDNSYVFAVFSKFSRSIAGTGRHVVLVNPSDMGNLGTIIRTVAAFGDTGLAITGSAADIFNPKTVRASMGALFRINFCLYESFDEYRAVFPDYALFPFMTDGSHTLSRDKLPITENERFTIIFGNEADGLPEAFRDMGVSVRIPQTGQVDSLNLPVAVGVGLFTFIHNSAGK